MVRWCWVNFQCWGVLLTWIRVGQGPTALAVGTSEGCLDMVLGKLPVPGRPTILVGEGPIALAVGAGGGGLDIFTLIYPFLSFSLSLGDGPI